MPIDEIKTICFVGAGTMGCVNSMLAAVSGYEAMIYDISAEALQQVPERQKEIGDFLVANGLYNSDEVEKGLDRIRLVFEAKRAAENADLLSESVFERRELKRSIFNKFDELCPSRTILTTNTSTLLVSEIEDVVKRGDKFAALHSHFGSALFDIMGGPRTSPITIDLLKRYVLSIKGIPLLLKKEHSGYLFNSIIGALMATAMILVIGGHGGIEDVDRAWMIGQDSQMGPFGWMDYVGLNVIYDGTLKNLKDKDKEASARKILKFLEHYIDKNELGYKTGKGFYSYPNAGFYSPDTAQNGEEAGLLYDILFTVQAANGLLLVIDGYANPEDVDRAWMAAQNFNIGPFGLIDRKGIDSFLDLLKIQASNGVITEDDTKKIVVYLRPYLEKGEIGKKTGKGFYTYPEPEYENSGFLTGI